MAIDTDIAPILEGTDGDQIDAAIERMDRAIKGNPIARCAVETALWDGLARRLGVSVARLFGGPVRTEMPVAWTLASGGSDTDIAEAQEMIERRRHNIFKLKIGKRGVAEDVAHVARIAEAVGDRASIRVDVDQAWSFDEARRGLRGLREIGVDLVEQPINAGHLDQLKVLTDLYEIAVMADEALQGPETAMRAAAHRSAVAFAVKIGQSGGLKHCLVNSCTHRDAMLCRFKARNARTFTCPFHGPVQLADQAVPAHRRRPHRGHDLLHRARGREPGGALAPDQAARGLLQRLRHGHAERHRGVPRDPARLRGRGPHALERPPPGLTKPRIAIIGAGIGGLAAALALDELGLRATIYEQAGALTEIGAAIALSANATRELERFGCLPGIAAAGCEPTELIYRGWRSQDRIAAHPVRRGGAYRAAYGAP